MPFPSSTSPLQAINSPLFPEVQLWIKRDDLLHPNVSGNKFRKLKYILRDAIATQATLVSMGGAWSNHLHALAHAAKMSGLNSVGLIRGLYSESEPRNPTLADCAQLGMELRFVSREDYRQLRVDNNYWQNFVENDQNMLWIPEGGRCVEGIQGMAELIEELPFHPDLILTACGSGTSMTGLIAGMRGHGVIIGICAVQNAQYLEEDVRLLLEQAGYPAYLNYQILHEFTYGGFGKITEELKTFCREFTQQTGIPTDPMYTGKLFYAVHQLCIKGQLPKGQNIVAVHSGGLQGSRGIPNWNEK
ncbi:1-aminocyclopropane-1-carboxylate deaminase/D-cysteine desulfhydrase [Undibacterium fentianense]|uniref:Pyridoxal-phosphate dependent enzyme n=1 Tax=Undibacterium fentianense TaxID=2828728 RepID=A0A941E605_9BURK|nr:pyridoxal-phosphate dependent enzyme [Undibacterium fentianense]MBR7801787.1 pyridoxal-phosphate dependent enzyme [Undibacterium fentianense]